MTGKHDSPAGAEYFGELRVEPELKRQTVRGGSATLLASVVGTVFQIAGTVVMARILVPRDFGLVTMVTTFSLLLQNCGMNGLTEAIIQAPHLTQRQTTALFWLGMATSASLALLLLVGAGPLASLYREPEVEAIARWVSLTVLLGGLSTCHLALLRRKMRFGRTARTELASGVLSIALGIALARAGCGYWALVAREMAAPAVLAAGAWTSCRWRPTFRPAREGVREMVSFAAHTYAHFITAYGARNVDKFLVGWHSGSIGLGNYKKAFDLFALPVAQLSTSLTNVALSGLGRLRSDPVRYRRNYLAAVTSLSFLGVGVSAIVTAAGPDIVRLILGPNWDEAGRIITLLGPSIGVVLIYRTHGWLHLSLGKADRWFWWGVLEVSVTSCAFVIALPYGPTGVAAAFSIAHCFLLAPGISYAGRPIGLRFRNVLAAVWRLLLAGTASVVASQRLLDWIDSVSPAYAGANSLLRTMAASSIATLLYVIGVVALHRGAGPLTKIAELAAVVLPARRPTGPATPAAGLRG